MTDIMDKIRLLSIFTAFISLIVLADGVLVAYLYPEHDSAIRYAVPLFFWLLYSAVIIVFKKGIDSENAVKYMMYFKGGKMFLTLSSMFVLAFLFRDSAKEIVITFFVYYILLLLPETMFLASKNK